MVGLQQPDLSISIINTNNRQLTLQCLRSLFANTHATSLEVFVVDNACTDGSSEAIAVEFAQVKIVRNETRLGFSTNNNQALSQARGRYLMILNDDTVVQPGAFDTLVAYMDEHPEAGACGPRLINADGSEQQSFDYFLGPVAEAFRPLSLLPRNTRTPDCATAVERVIGACMLVRRQVAETVGLLDPDFDPLYSEETDWCYRIRHGGWAVYLVPQATVVHLGGQTMKRVKAAALIGLYRKKTLFFRKHRGAGAASLFKVCLLLASLTKLAAWSVALPLPGCHERARDAVWSHWQVFKGTLSF